jgi:hypothetical protein
MGLNSVSKLRQVTQNGRYGVNIYMRKSNEVDCRLCYGIVKKVLNIDKYISNDSLFSTGVQNGYFHDSTTRSLSFIFTSFSHIFCYFYHFREAYAIEAEMQVFQ